MKMREKKYSLNICPVCNKDCYEIEEGNDYACVDPDCEFSIGFKAYMDKLINEEDCDI
jgi:hypothetical protein